MGTFRQGQVLIGLLLVAVLAAGCNVMAPLYFLLPTDWETKIEPKCKLSCEDKDKNKEVKVVILASSGLETRPEFLRVDSELSGMMVRLLQDYYKEKKLKVTLVPTSRVEKYKDEHPNWHSLSPEEIGKHFHADYVIDLEVDRITLYEPGSFNKLYHGRAEISVTTIDLHQPDEAPILKEEYTCEYPKAQGPIPADDSNAEQFRLKFLRVIAQQLSWYFIPHDADQDTKLDF
jgi:hypothetical protein